MPHKTRSNSNTVGGCWAIWAQLLCWATLNCIYFLDLAGLELIQAHWAVNFGFRPTKNKFILIYSWTPPLAVKIISSFCENEVQ